MDEQRKRAILDEARRNVAERDNFEPVRTSSSDPMVEWRSWHAARERERAAAAEELERSEAEVRRARAAAVESVAALSARVESLRAAVYDGDEECMRAMCDTVLPLIERVADRLEKTIKGIDQRVSERLQELEREVRSAISKPRTEDLPSLRSVN